MAVLLGFLFALAQGTAHDDPFWVTLVGAGAATCFVGAILKLQARWLNN